MKNRKEAMEWWNGLSPEFKISICEYNTELLCGTRLPETLTGREIQCLYEDKCRADAEIIDMAFNNDNKNRGTQRSPFGMWS